MEREEIYYFPYFKDNNVSFISEELGNKILLYFLTFSEQTACNIVGIGYSISDGARQGL